MKILSLLISLSLSTLTCGQKDDICNWKGNSTKLLACDQGFWRRTDNDLEPFCSEQSQEHQYERVDIMKKIRGTQKLPFHVSSFIINNEQYQLFTDNKAVIMTKWSEDEQRLLIKQRLYISSAQSAEVIFHNGNAILLVAVYNISKGCTLCDLHDHENPSRAFLWNHTRKEFDEDHIKNLPSARFKVSYSERYSNNSTVITVFSKCGCKTRIYYLDKSSKFWEIDQNNSLLFRDEMVLQSVRYLGSENILFAPLNRYGKSEPIRIFKWAQSTGSLTFHRNLSTYINANTGLSTTVFKNDIFLCSVSDASPNVTIYRLNPDRGHLEEVRHFQGEKVFSMCKFFTQDQELYAAIGFEPRVELLQYNPVARNFTNAGNLPIARNSIDLISFQSRDDAYIVTAGNYRKNEKIKKYLRNKVYKKIHIEIQNYVDPEKIP